MAYLAMSFLVAGSPICSCCHVKFIILAAFISLLCCDVLFVSGALPRLFKGDPKFRRSALRFDVTPRFYF